MAFMDLFRPRWKHSDEVVRKDAVKELTNSDTLLKIATDNSERWSIREVASDILTTDVRKTNDLNVLTNLAMNDKYYEVRRIAASKLSDQTTLIQIARNDKTWTVRAAAAKKIADQTILVEIARNDAEEGVREIAVKNIFDQDILIDIAKNDADWGVRYSAVTNIDSLVKTPWAVA